jgi:hypothetical protein
MRFIAAAGRARAFQPDLPQGDGTARKHRHADIAVDLEVEAGDGANLPLHGQPHRVLVDHP